MCLLITLLLTMLLLVIMAFCLSSWSFMAIPNIADDAFSNYDWKQVIA